MRFFFQTLFFLISLVSQNILPQEKIIEKTDIKDLYRLSEVVVSATKTQTSTIELANSITVIDSAEIANRNASTVFGLLRNEYGLSTTTQGGQGSLSNIYIRGGNSSHTLVLIDGVEANLVSDPSNVYDFSSLSTDNVQAIEILRGSQSTLYGSNSLAGVINIISKKGKDKPSFSLFSEAGSFKTFRNSLGMIGKISDFNYSVTLSRSESEGFSAASEKYGNTEKDGYKKDNVSARFGYEFNQFAELNLYMNYLNSKSEYDQMSGKLGDDSTYIFDQEEYSFQGETKFNLISDKWNQKLGASILRNTREYKYDYSEFNSVASNSLYDGRKIKFDWQNNLTFIENHIITFGLENTNEIAASENFYSSPFFTFESIFPEKSSNIMGAYLQDQLKIGQKFFGTVGVRVDKHDKYGSAFTYRVAPAYVIWETETKIKATIGSGFKSPSLFNLYDPAFGNQNLKPEKSFSFDAGVEQFFTNNSVVLGITYFQNNYNDLMGFDANFKVLNINKAKTQGVETYITANLFDNVLLKINYTYTNAKDESEGLNEEDRKLVRRPDHKISGYVNYNFLSKANANVELIYVGKRDDLIFDNATFTSSRIQLDPYVLVNISANYQLMEFLRLNLRLENVLNSDYEEVYGYATPGFSIYGGVKISINDL